MFYVVTFKDSGGNKYLYLVRAESLDHALIMIGCTQEHVDSCAITKDTFESLSSIDAGYVKIML